MYLPASYSLNTEEFDKQNATVHLELIWITSVLVRNEYVFVLLK